MMALAKAGEAVILPTPWYFNHKMTLDMLGIEAVALPCRAETGFVPDPRRGGAADRRQRPRHRARHAQQPDRGDLSAGDDPRLRRALRAARHRARHRRDLSRFHRRRELRGRTTFSPASIGGRRWSSSTASRRPTASPAIAWGRSRRARISSPRSQRSSTASRSARAARRSAALVWAIEALAAWREANRAIILDRAAAFRQAIAGLDGWSIDSIGAYFAYLRHPFPGTRGAEVASWLAAERGVLCLPGLLFRRRPGGLSSRRLRQCRRRGNRADCRRGLQTAQCPGGLRRRRAK